MKGARKALKRNRGYFKGSVIKSVGGVEQWPSETHDCLWKREQDGRNHDRLASTEPNTAYSRGRHQVTRETDIREIAPGFCSPSGSGSHLVCWCDYMLPI